MSGASETLGPILPERIESLAREVLQAAHDRDLAIATAESCTGGLLAALLTDVEGLSHVFERGFVTYSDAAKCDLLGLSREVIDDCGAVSEPVARAMAMGARRRSRADIVVSVTGFAGPGAAGDEEGLVHFAVIGPDGHCATCEDHFGKRGRDGVRIAALERALTMMKNATLNG
ncbi:CinA family protein [Qipengyuania nanhaisediminis]|uniref:CinA family protein n=1 Tax=Qipengyuania nanhaisediminis TaxID=604088 RepID=UPI0038B2B235